MKRFLARAALLILFVGAALAIWAFLWEPGRLVTRNSSAQLSCWRGSPLRIAIASDLHIGSPHTGVDKLREIVGRINAGNPDVIVLLGDFVIQGIAGGRKVAPEIIAPELGALRAPLGVYAVLGNHDWWLDARRVRTAFESAGLTMLEDSAVRLPFAGGAFWLAGVSDFLEGPHDVARALASIDDDLPVIVITHNPDVFPQIPSRACLTLAGHTHGGQVALPLVGRPIVPSKYGQRYAIGHIHENGRRLFVTSGIGPASSRCASGCRRRLCFSKSAREGRRL